MVVARLLLVFVTILWFYFLWSRRKYYACAWKIPGPIGLPFIGIVHKIIKMEDMLYEFPKFALQYKTKTYFSWLGIYPMIYTKEPKVAEIILNSPDCINKSALYDVLNEAVGHGLLTIKSPDWNKRRKLLNPCFSSKVLLKFIPIFNKFSQELCEILHKQINSGEVNVKDLLFNLSLKSAVASTMGLDFEQKSDIQFIGYFERALEITVHRALRPWLRNSTLFKYSSLYKPFREANTIIIDFISDLVMKKIKIFEQTGLKDDTANSKEESFDIEKTKHIFINQVIKIYQKNEITFSDVIEESKLIVFAGFETTANTLFATLMCLAMHPQYQEKVFDEIITIFPEKDFNVRNGDLKNFVYLDMCINETLRVVSTVPLIVRQCTNDITVSEDIVIPEGSHIVIDILNIQRDEDTWGPNAKIFDPEHFLPTNLAEKHKYSFLPFSKGPRQCIGWQYAGMLLKVVLVQILRKYRFSTKFRFDDLRFVENVTLKFDKTPHLEVEMR